MYDDNKVYLTQYTYQLMPKSAQLSRNKYNRQVSHTEGQTDGHPGVREDDGEGIDMMHIGRS